MIKQICKDFLSFLQDHYNKNNFWRNNSLEKYERAFRSVPPVRLKEYFDLYLEDHMPQFLPTLTALKEFARAQPTAREEWFLFDRGTFCRHCRTDDEGKEGGWRILWTEYYDPNAGLRGEGQTINDTISPRCNCEAAETLKGELWTDMIRTIIRIDPKAAIRYDHWCEPNCTHCLKVGAEPAKIAGKQRATHQSNLMWKLRIENGYVEIIEEDGQRYYSAIWEHDFWTTSMAKVMAHSVGWTIPDEVLARKKKKVKKKDQKNLLLDETVDKIFTIYQYGV